MTRGVLALLALSLASPARAELVFFTSGRTMSVVSHEIDGPSVVLTLREGGQVVCDRAIVARIAPDEVPYPEPPRPADVPTQVAVDAGNRDRTHGGDRSVYDPIIDRVSAEQGVDSKLVRAVIQVESAYQERARSPKGAVGLMQLMPDTARLYAVADPYDPSSNIDAGTRHLKSLLARFSLPLALAAYNAGEAAVARFRAIPPYPETRDYVQRILQLVRR
jgi:soluble lytic murein transglycosylase-like protein